MTHALGPSDEADVRDARELARRIYVSSGPSVVRADGRAVYCALERVLERSDLKVPAGPIVCKVVK